MAYKNQNDYEVLNLYNDDWEIKDGILQKCCIDNCDELEVIKVPSGTFEIGMDAFEYIDMKEVYLPQSVSVIRCCAFRECSELKKIYIANPDVFLEKGCFYQIYNLDTVIIGGRRIDTVVTKTMDDDGNESNCLERYVGRESVYYVDDDIRTIGGMAFYNYKRLQKIVLSNSVEEIETLAFSTDEESSLMEVELPDSLRIIGYGAFLGCNIIEELKIPQSVEFIDKDAFEGWEDWQRIVLPYKFKQSKFFQKWRHGCDAQIIYY